MRRCDSNHMTVDMLATAKVLREAAETFWRAAERTSDPERYRALAMEYHTIALKLEHGGCGA